MTQVGSRRIAQLRSAVRPIRSVLAGAALASTMLFGGTGLGALPVPAASAATLDAISGEAQFLQLLNADRVANGLPQLQLDTRLSELARWRSEDMMARGYFSHDFDGRMVFHEMKDRQISYTSAGENLAYNTYDETRTVGVAQTSLMDSPTHRANILNADFALVGVGIAVGSNQKTIYTQLFLQS